MVELKTKSRASVLLEEQAGELTLEAPSKIILKAPEIVIEGSSSVTVKGPRIALN